MASERVSPGEAAGVVLAASGLRPALGCVLGSGLGEAVRTLEVEARIPYGSIPGFRPGGVPGHAGEWLMGRWDGVPVAVLAGRIHYYEGYDPGQVTFPIRVLAAAGVRAVLLTNAAGGIRAGLEPGSWVAISDHLNLLGANPLRGPGGAERFVDLSEVYAPRLRGLLRRAGGEAGVVVSEGVYAAVAGPSYETPAEVRALGVLGADVVGMSTASEAIVARQCGLEVAGLSCVTNRAAGLGGAISHEEVLAVGRRVGGEASRLLAAFARFYGEDESTRQGTPGGGGAGGT
jgi:purine-nucleoside phosphorylase